MKKGMKLFALLLSVVMLATVAGPMNMASAAITSKVTDRVEEEGKTAFFDANLHTDNVGVIYGAKVYIICKNINNGLGGGIVVNAENNNWDSKEWGDEYSAKEITLVATGKPNEYTITRLDKAPMFKKGETYSNLAIQQWWGADMEITKVDFLDAKGNSINPVKEEVKEEPKAQITIDIPVAPETPAGEPEKPAKETDTKVVVEKKDQTIKIKTDLDKAVSAKFLKIKDKSFTIKATSTGSTKLTYTMVSSPSSKITISKSGKVTLARGIKKGNYKLKVKVKAAASKEFNAAAEEVVFTIRVQ